MIELKLNIDDEIMNFNIPQSWDEVTVEQFSNIYKVKQGLNDIEKTVALTSALTKIDEEFLYLMTPEQFKNISDCLSFMNEEVKQKQVESIQVGDETFYLKSDYDSLNLGEIASIEMLMESSSAGLLDVMPELLCIFLRKKKENGKLENFRNEHMERAEKFKAVKISDVNKLFLFFSSGKKASTATMKPSLVKRKPVKKKK